MPAGMVHLGLRKGVSEPEDLELVWNSDSVDQLVS